MSTKSRARAFILSAGLVVLPASALSADMPMLLDQPEQQAFVTLGATSFNPDTIVIRAGQTVTWSNTSSAAHTVTADPARAGSPASVQLPPGAPPFDSGTLQPGQQFQYTFTVPGEYRYFCVPHEGIGMIGRVIVEP